MTKKKRVMSKGLVQKQELAKALLLKKGIDYYDWLEENCDEVIYDNLDTLTKSIQSTNSKDLLATEDNLSVNME